MEQTAKWCSKCGKLKYASDFPPGRRMCRRCIANYAVTWRTRHLERVNREQRERYARRYKDDPVIQEGYRRRRMKRLFGMTPAQYDAMLAAQDGKCAICGRTENATRGHNGNKQKRRMPIDHDHVTGRVRGILCSRCNIVLGWIENKELFEKITMYLK